MSAPDPYDSVVIYDDDLLGTELYADLVGPLQHDRSPWTES